MHSKSTTQLPNYQGGKWKEKQFDQNSGEKKLKLKKRIRGSNFVKQ